MITEQTHALLGTGTDKLHQVLPKLANTVYKSNSFYFAQHILFCL